MTCTRCGNPADHTTETCCSSHNRVLCHMCYRITHWVEICNCPKCVDRERIR